MTVNNDTKTLGPTLLKATLCVTPLLLLLLLNTASDANETDENKDDVYKLCVQLAVDLLDAVEMIDIVLDEKEHNYGISQGFIHWTKKWICFKFAQRKYDANLCKLGNKSEQRW